MRVVKYRGWIDLEERYGGQVMGIVCKIDEMACEVGLYDHGNFSMSEVVLMQYTGLKDKNGTDIYEGDVVKETIKLERGKRQEAFCEVFYHNGMFKYKQPLVYGHKTLEVVGHIYENLGLHWRRNK